MPLRQWWDLQNWELHVVGAKDFKTKALEEDYDNFRAYVDADFLPHTPTFSPQPSPSPCTCSCTRLPGSYGFRTAAQADHCIIIRLA